MPSPIHSLTSHQSDLSKAKSDHVTTQLETFSACPQRKVNLLTWLMRPYMIALLPVSPALFSPCWAPVTECHLQFPNSMLLHQLLLLALPSTIYYNYLCTWLSPPLNYNLYEGKYCVISCCIPSTKHSTQQQSSAQWIFTERMNIEILCSTYPKAL